MGCGGGHCASGLQGGLGNYSSSIRGRGDQGTMFGPPRGVGGSGHCNLEPSRGWIDRGTMPLALTGVEEGSRQCTFGLRVVEGLEE